jgi:murein DD-endopeptidase MepM/ murein hydrolase activator NlpD
VSRYHNGIDYATGVGTPVIAAANGVVIATSTGWSGGYGNQIVVSHGNGVATRYAHLNSVKVSSGQTVVQGQLIGYSGNSGNSTGPHLHFEKIVNGRTVNPF